MPSKDRYWSDPVKYRQRAREDMARRRQQGKIDGSAKRAGAAKQRHGLTPEEFGELWQRQEGNCYLCGYPLKPGKTCHIDHDHSHCGSQRSCQLCRRGLAHYACNVFVGWMRDDPDRIRSLADNLQSAMIAVRARITAEPQEPSLFGELREALAAE